MPSPPEIFKGVNVLYDISGLRALSLHHHALTGVPRVIENVLLGLAAMDAPDCHVTACALDSPNLARAYFERRLAGTGLAFAPPPVTNVAGRLISTADRQLHASLSRRAWPWRVLRGLSLPAIRRASAYLGRLPPALLAGTDVYHSPHGPIPAQIRAGAGGRQPQVALTVYDLIPFQHPEFFPPGLADAQRAILKTTRPQEDWYVCISECTKRDLCEAFQIDPARVFVTLLAANAEVFHPCAPDVCAGTQRRYGIPPGPYVMSLCTLEPRKNVRTIIEAFAQIVLAGEMRDLSLVLVGGRGWLDHDFQEVLARWPEVRRRVVLPGYVPDEDLAPLYSGALCFAYLSHYEGFGLPPLEAMRCGVPVLVSNTSSLPEVVGEEGLYFAPRDSEGVAQAILDLARDPSRRAALGARSLARAETFSWARCARETVAAYRVMAASSAGER